MFLDFFFFVDLVCFHHRKEVPFLVRVVSQYGNLTALTHTSQSVFGSSMLSAKQEATMAGRRRLTAAERQEIADKRRAQKPHSVVRIEVDEWTDDAGDPVVREVRITKAEVRSSPVRER
jgi:hypothetical protein